MMRILMDEERTSALKLPGKSRASVFAYTNHTMMPEALEKWSVGCLKSCFPDT
jgi:glycogen phosphorylase